MVQEDISKKNAQDRIVELTRKCTEYQKLINELSGEIQRLNEILRTKLQEITILDSKLQHLGGENERLEGQLRAHGDKDSKIDDYENKFALISLEVERLNSNLKLKLQQATEQEQQLAAARKDNTRLKEQLSDLSFRLNQSSQEINDLRRQLQQKEDDLSRMRGSEMKSSEYQAEIQKLNQIVKMKLDELRDR
jgi:chromosome segregation ATPase